MKELPMLATIHDVADFLGWTESKLRNRIQRGSGHPPFVPDGRRIVFRRDDVLAWYGALSTVEAADSPTIRRARAVKGRWPDRKAG